MRRILVTGGAGFIGSNFIRMLLGRAGEDRIVCLDALTYAGNRDNLEGLESTGRFRFIHGDIRDAGCVQESLQGITHVVHFAAESHVDRSIVSGDEFLSTNVAGTHVLLTGAREAGVERFVHIGTDEVYGSVEPPHTTDEEAPLRPTNPYSASKAAADHLALAHHRTYGLDVCITRCGNNYGPRQFPEKLFALSIVRLLNDEPVPVYGDGRNVRDWVYVEDHCRGVELVLDRGRPGEVYNLASRGGRENLEVLRAILAHLGKPEELLQPVADRPGHDRRYAVDPTKAEKELGFRAQVPLDEGIRRTVAWYRENESWWRKVLERTAHDRKHWLEEPGRTPSS